MEASMMKRRPFSGSCTTCSFSIDGAEARGLRSHNRRIADDSYLFLKASNREIEIDARLLARRQTDALAAHRLEASERDIQPVLARNQARRRVHAIAG
jgi:hypothetical protein